MSKNYADIGAAYYTAWGEKNVAAMGVLLHPDVQIIGPLAETVGKEVILEGLRRGAAHFNTLNIRAKFSSGDQAMVVLDLHSPAPVGITRSASLLTFRDGLIAKIELFFDASPMQNMKEKIWKKSNS